ncbi:MAG: DUF2892 domain-containing protein [Alphaproteobacteria bacterium]|nr:DUF2892 domain-containing protein [Alphaproteobacteria bacterium]
MNIDRFVLGFAGAFVLISLGLSQLWDPRFLYLTALVGLMLFQSSLTKFCPLVLILKKFGLKTGRAFD